MNKRSFALHVCAVLCAALLLWSPAGAQQVTIARDSNLHAEPKADAPVVAQLKQGTTAQAIGRQGPWVNVKSAAGTGWLFSFNVTYATAPGSAPAAGAARASRPHVAPTIGIRGLDEEDLKRAQFDAKQLDTLDQFAAPGDDAQKGREPAARGPKK